MHLHWSENPQVRARFGQGGGGNGKGRYLHSLASWHDCWLCILHKRFFVELGTFLRKMLRNFPRNFLSLYSVGLKKSRKIPAKFPCKNSNKNHRRASAGAQGELLLASTLSLRAVGRTAIPVATQMSLPPVLLTPCLNVPNKFGKFWAGSVQTGLEWNSPFLLEIAVVCPCPLGEWEKSEEKWRKKTTKKNEKKRRKTKKTKKMWKFLRPHLHQPH